MAVKIKYYVIVFIFLCLFTGCREKEPNVAEDIPKELPSTLKLSVSKRPGAQQKSYEITGMGISHSDRVAIINDQMYVSGTEIDHGVFLKEVSLTYARIFAEGREHLIRPANIQQLIDKGLL